MFNIYMMFKGRKLLVEENIEKWFTAFQHCELYFNRNPKEYIIKNIETGEEYNFFELY